MTKFKPGDRVAVYDYLREWMGEPGTVIEIDEEGVCVSVGDVKRDIWLHPKQLRPLVSKKRQPPASPEKVAREWFGEWERRDGIGVYFVPEAMSKVALGTFMTLREVLPGQVVVTRESLAKAYCNGREYISLDELCKSLGLEEKRK